MEKRRGGGLNRSDTVQNKTEIKFLISQQTYSNPQSSTRIYEIFIRYLFIFFNYRQFKKKNDGMIFGFRHAFIEFSHFCVSECAQSFFGHEKFQIFALSLIQLAYISINII